MRLLLESKGAPTRVLIREISGGWWVGLQLYLRCTLAMLGRFMDSIT